MRRTPLLFFAAAVAVAACGDNETPPSAKGNYVGAAPQALPCVPNQDGQIDANELSPILGATANYLVSPAGKERAVDLVGAQRDGKTVWTFNADYPDDQVAPIVATPLEGHWFADKFPNAVNGFVTPLDAAGNNLGVYTHDDQAFSLHGIASKDDGPQKTYLPYETPIALYRFPLKPGLTYTTTADVKNGVFQGLPYAGRDTYEVKVDAAGEVVLSDLTAQQALRVKTKVTVAPSAGIVTVTRQTSFLFECIGELVRATSKPGEENEDFTTAAELRRLGLSQ
jgi:hypothetical protein